MSSPPHLLSHDIKEELVHTESVSVTSSDGRRVDLNKVWRKMDICIVPFIACLYLLTFLDRTNIGNARVAGLQEDLGLTNYQYTVALTVTYVPYICVEIPSNLVLRTIGPNILLPALLSAWGVVSALQGLVTSFRQLLVCRFFIGLLEGGAYPGFVLYLSLFYPKTTLTPRVSAFFTASSLSGAFSGIMAHGIIHLDGTDGRAGWRWILIIEGAITVFFGFAAFWVMPRDIMSARFLTHEERVYVAELVKEAERPEKAKLNWRGTLKAACSRHSVFLYVATFCAGTNLNSLAYFAPSIVQSVGYSAARTQLMVVPPYAVSFAVALVASYVADRYSLRGLTCVFVFSVSLTGFVIFLVASNSHIRYGTLFLIIPGSYIGVPVSMAWNTANNSESYKQRAVVVGITSMAANCGGMFAVWLMGEWSTPPAYTLGTKVLIAFSAMSLACSACCLAFLVFANSRQTNHHSQSSRRFLL